MDKKVVLYRDIKIDDENIYICNTVCPQCDYKHTLGETAFFCNLFKEWLDELRDKPVRAVECIKNQVIP